MIILDFEDKKLISLWYSTKFSLESIDLILEILLQNFKLVKNLVDHNNLVLIFDSLLELMNHFKHMGAISILNSTMLKITSLVIKITN